jgi:hypothetical protein
MRMKLYQLSTFDRLDKAESWDDQCNVYIYVQVEYHKRVMRYERK